MDYKERELREIFADYPLNRQGAYDLLSMTAEPSVNTKATSVFRELLQESASYYKTDSPFYCTQALFSAGWPMHDADDGVRMLYEQEPEKLVTLSELASPVSELDGIYDEQGKLVLDEDMQRAAQNLSDRGRNGVLSDFFNQYDGHDLGLQFLDDVVYTESMYQKDVTPRNPEEMAAFFNQVFARFSEPTPLDTLRTEQFFQETPYSFSDALSHMKGRESSRKNEPEVEDYYPDRKSLDLIAKQFTGQASDYLQGFSPAEQDGVVSTVRKLYQQMDHQLSVPEGYEPDLSKPLYHLNADGFVKQTSQLFNADPPILFEPEYRFGHEQELTEFYNTFVRGMETVSDFEERKAMFEGFDAQVILQRAYPTYLESVLSSVEDSFSSDFDFSDIDFGREPDPSIEVPQMEADFVKDYTKQETKDLGVEAEPSLEPSYVQLPVIDTDEKEDTQDEDSFSFD